jgi:hypothetical protein
MKASRWRGTALVPLLAFAAHALAADGQAGSTAPMPPGSPAGATAPANVPSGETRVETSSQASVLVPDSLKGIELDSWTSWFQPGRWGGSLGLDFNGQRQRISAPDSAGQSFDSRITDERFTIRNEDFGLIDRRLMSGTIGLTLGLQQFRQVVDDVKSSEHEKLIGYNFDLAFLGETPYRSNVYANRTQSTTALISGGTSKTEVENRGLIMRWGENSILRTRNILPYFSASLEAVQERDKETTRIEDAVFRQDDRRESIALAAHNGTETSDLNFKYATNRVKDYLNDTNSYRDDTASLIYSLDFGSTHNWRWDSTVDYYKRHGSDELSLSNTNVSEVLAVDHYDNLSTAYNYQYSRQISQEGTVVAQNAGALLQHRLYDNLLTSAGVSGFKQTLPTGSADSRVAQLNMSYNHGIPWSGQMSAGAGGSYAINHNHVPGGAVPVVDAPYTAPPSFGSGAGFQLKEPFIEVATISIVDVKGSGRIPTVVNVDYLVVVDGYRTTIQPLPTSVIIMPNDKLEVSYVYEVPPDLKYRLTTRVANLGLFWPWIAFSYSHDEQDSTPLSGGDASLLVSDRRDSARLTLTGAWDNLQARGDAGVLRHRGNQLEYENVTLDEFINYYLTRDLSLSLSANQYRTNYTIPVRRVSGNAIRLDANLSWENWLANAYALQRRYLDTEVPSEKYQEVGFKVHRRWLKLDVTAAVYLNRRYRGGTETQNATVQFAVVRQF